MFSRALEDQVTEVEKRRLSLQQQLKQIDTERKSQYTNLETFVSSLKYSFDRKASKRSFEMS